MSSFGKLQPIFELLLLSLLVAGCRPSPTPAPIMPLASLTATPAEAVTRPLPQWSPTKTAVPPTSPPTDWPMPTPLAGGMPLPSPPTLATPTLLPPTNTPTATSTPSPVPPNPTETPSPIPPTATPVPTATAKPKVPTPTPTSAYRFLPTGPPRPDPSHPCSGCPKAPAYIVGHVTDAASHPLAGVRLVCYNEWHRYPAVASKDSGEYDFPILQAEATWYVVVLDQNGQPISPEVPVPFNPVETCRYLLDWRRVN